MPEEHEQRLITLVRTKEQPWPGAVAGCVAAQDTARLDALTSLANPDYAVLAAGARDDGIEDEFSAFIESPVGRAARGGAAPRPARNRGTRDQQVDGRRAEHEREPAAAVVHGACNLRRPHDPPAGHEDQQLPPRSSQEGCDSGQDQEDEQQFGRGEALDRIPRPGGQPQCHRRRQRCCAQGQAGLADRAQAGRTGDQQAEEAHRRRHGEAGHRPPHQVAPQADPRDRQGPPYPVLLLLQEHEAHHDADQDGDDDREGHGSQLRNPGADHDAPPLQHENQLRQARARSGGHDQREDHHPHHEPVAQQTTAIGLHEGQNCARRHQRPPVRAIMPVRRRRARRTPPHSQAPDSSTAGSPTWAGA